MTLNKIVGKKYKIVVKHPTQDRHLFFHADVLNEDEHFITFIDRNAVVYTFNKHNVISMQEVKNGNV